MSNLIPELRVDKNGRTVTKHVRATAKASDAKSLPSPTLGTKRSRAEKEGRIEAVLTAIKPRSGISSMREKLRNMDPDILSRIETLAHGNDEVNLWKATHNWLVTDIINDSSEENQLLFLNAIEAFDDDYQEWADVRSLLSLRKIPEFAPYAEDFREAPAEVALAARRLGEYRNELEGFVKLYADTRTNNRLKSRELEAVILNEPEKASALIDWTVANSDKNLTPIDSELALRVINRPQDRDAIAEMLGTGFNDSKVIGLVLDRPESRDQIFDLYNGGVKQIEAINEVLDGNVQSSLASGIL